MSTTAENMGGANGVGAGMGAGMGGGAEAGRASQLSKFFDDVEDLLGRVSHLEDKDIARLRSRVEGSIERVRTTASEGVHAAMDSARSAVEATDDYVYRKPWVAIGATAIACLAIGALLRGK
jgi:ElaB/YqjD/DUF883 family membrane-anchored ribosome-binding protein